MPNKKLVLRKLSQINLQLKHLKELTRLTDAKLFGEARNCYFAERVIERLIGAAIDINMHLISDLGFDLPQDYFGSFIRLGEHKILSKKLAAKLAPSTKLRNILVHEYEEVDTVKFKKAFKSALADYAAYAVQILRFI